MDSNEFWCRAFLVAMQGNYVAPDGVGVTHDISAAYCEREADAALAVAQRRGMVTGEGEASAIEFSRLPGSDLWKVTGGPEDLLGVEVLAGRDVYPLADCRTLRVTWSGARIQGRLEARPVEASIERPIVVSVAGEREAPAPAAGPRDDGKPARVEAGQRWSIDFRDVLGAIEEHTVESTGDELARLSGPRGVRYVTMREMLTSPRFAFIGPAEAPAPKLERVEFTAARDTLRPDWWGLRVRDVGVFFVRPCDERASIDDGPAMRIKWSETSQPKPIEVWIERAKGGA